jgi:hypothetical protein
MVKMDYVILARITPTRDKHVCRSCGADATLLNIGYEPITQDHADTFYTEIKKASDFATMKKLAHSSSLANTIQGLTRMEQEKGAPCEHSTLYYCAPCLSHVIFLMTSKKGAGEAFLSLLFTSPPTHALFVTYSIIQDCTLLIHSITQDASLVHKMLNTTK